MTTETLLQEFRKGDEVVICDGVNTGLFGTIGGDSEAGSVAVCIEGSKGHECYGMCPMGGTFEPKYALLKVTDENKQAIKLLVAKLETISSTRAERDGEILKHPALQNLKEHQTQLDEEGIMVGVSRQALCEMFALLVPTGEEEAKYCSCEEPNIENDKNLPTFGICFSCDLPWRHVSEEEVIHTPS